MSETHLRLTAVVLALFVSGCAPIEPEQTPPPPPPAKVKTTYRVISGISMGAIGTAALGLQRPERFDGIAILGGPLDAALLLRTIDSFHLGGFCSRDALEALMAQDPAKLNDPVAIRACARMTTPIHWERVQHFNHWAYTNNGGTFDRGTYLDLFTDLTLAYGNLIYDNPESPFAPPGVPVERLRRPPADFCSKPTVVKNLRNAEFNPDGKYDAITFCDGEPPTWVCRADGTLVDFCSDPANVAQPLQPSVVAAFAETFCKDKGGAQRANGTDHPLLMLNHAGRVDACRVAREPLTVALALDMNGNGRRDYGEPVINNGFERHDDVGADGCADAFEDGRGGCSQTASPGAVDPNRDNYDADSNPLGTEQNWLWEDGEPFRDHGLDGVPATGDSGEGNGAYDLSGGRKALLAYDARANYRRLDPAGRARVNFLLDGGIRDLFNFGLGSKQIHGLVRHLRPESTALYRDFHDIPGVIDRNGRYRPWHARWSSAPANLTVLYGKDAPSDQDRVVGDGDHVGTTVQTVERISSLFNWVGAQWPKLERPTTPFSGLAYAERERIESYDSALLGGKREYAIYLPPGYELEENQDKRYPVQYFLHGYGAAPAGFVSTALMADAYMKDGNVNFRPMIMVFPSGRCCWVHRTTGARDCRESDENGKSIGSQSGFERECVAGNFYINRKGYTWEDAVPYGDAFFELMDEIDKRYRTLPVAEVEAR
ncbi:MAG: hypothetical protein WBV82_07030 [Myxococcaceae bacterium]